MMRFLHGKNTIDLSHQEAIKSVPARSMKTNLFLADPDALAVKRTIGNGLNDD